MLLTCGHNTTEAKFGNDIWK